MVDKVLSSGRTWPFPSKDNPLIPWTPEQQRQYEEQQRAKTPDAPMIGGFL